MKKDDLLFGLSEVCIYPKEVTNIRTRSQCNPKINGALPLFTAPMSTVVDEHSCDEYEKNGINVILPRSIEFNKRVKYIDRFFIAMGLGEAEDYCKENANYLNTLSSIKICIDIANGHMISMQETIRNLKREFGNKIEIMCGNIANPVTYRYLSEAGADYIRCGIGGGSGCLTASNTGIFYPMGSLILKCRKIQKQMEMSHKLNGSPKPAKIIADGGMKNYDYIIKALYLGADYAMCGRMFSQCWEAPGQAWKKERNESSSWQLIGEKTQKEEFRPDIYNYKKIFYGMSTKKAQAEIDKNTCKFKTSEGIIKEIPIVNTIDGWVENFVSYLTSAMSYTDCLTLEDIKQFENFSLMTYAASESYNR